MFWLYITSGVNASLFSQFIYKIAISIDQIFRKFDWCVFVLLGGLKECKWKLAEECSDMSAVVAL